MDSNSIFLDANILIRHLTQDNIKLSPKATQLIENIARKKLLAYVSTLVLHETTYVLEHVYDAKRTVIVDNLKKLLQIEHLRILDLQKENIFKALDDYKKHSVDFADAVYKQYAIENTLKIASFDNHFSKIQARNYKFF